jgi:UBX domain-containing protein 1
VNANSPGGLNLLTPNQARQYLVANNWDLPAALAEFYTAQEEAGAEHEQDDNHPSYEEEDEEDDTPVASNLPSGGRRLGDSPLEPQPIPISASSRSSQPKPKPVPQKKFATLDDFNSDPHAHDDDDGDDDDGKQDLFAGGEKSGLAVQNPDDIKKKILEKAMKGKPVPKEDPKPQSSHFTGSARTLGGDETPSRVIEPPSAPQTSRRGERVDRVLHFWSDGFSVDDGDLYRSDDPQNAEILNGIRQGRAPLSIMNITPGQEVDVEIKQHQENYIRPKKKYVPFGGQGNRLGSPTPGASSMPGSFTTTTAPSPPPITTEPPKVNVDDSQPTVSLQIRLGSGTRLPARFNATHTIGDVYSFVAAASPDSQNRQWVLQTTFPSTELTDPAKALGDMPEFKRGGVVVQKWK